MNTIPATNVYSQTRKDAPNLPGIKSAKKVKRVGPRSDGKAEGLGNADGDKDGESAKPKRVRTGCLTCRQRHLKCDEGMPLCNNCKKSNRTCRRGVRLNFIDTWTEQPPRLLSRYGTQDWKVEFLDESREIASEYQGGIRRYKHLDWDPPPSATAMDSAVGFDILSDAAAAAAATMTQMGQRPLPPHGGAMQTVHSQINQAAIVNHPFELPSRPEAAPFQPQPRARSGSKRQPQFSDASATVAHGSVVTTAFNPLSSDVLDEEQEKREYLDGPEETLFMQVFVEEVGLWMDSMDSQKHFSRLLPFYSLSEPMLLNAFLACGARHLTLVNPAYTEAKALHYYNTATRYLLKNLQNPNRDTVVCATTAVILHVYEIMSERALQRMNHLAGARALIKECGWNARVQGIGSACFWLNVGLEVLSCLHFNWQVAWDPDDWGVDMNFNREIQNGREEVWTHRMLYIIAKICNFRATTSSYSEPNERDERIRMQRRHEQWSHLKRMCDTWNDGIPRTMHPVSFLYTHQPGSDSVFPEVWMIKRATIVARLFFHTAMLLLAQIHPYLHTTNSSEMLDLQNRHAHMICGIVAHVKDRGVASVAIRSLAHAAEVLTDRKEQEEVLRVFEKINKETGWRIGFAYKELKEKWGWNEESSPHQFTQTHPAHRQAQEQQESRDRRMQEQAQQVNTLQLQQGLQFNQSQSMAAVQQSPLQPTPPQTQQSFRPSPGIPNPLYAKADFSLPQHPYQNFYVAPKNVQAGFGNPHGGGQFYHNV